MRRRFRPTLGGLVLENKGTPSSATTSNDSSTATQPTRRARFKPKVGIVQAPTQCSPGKTSKQTKVATTAGQPSTTSKTAISSINKAAGNLPSVGTKTGTSPVNKDGGIGQPSTVAKTAISLVNKIVRNQPSKTTSTGTSLVNKDGGIDQPSTGAKTAISPLNKASGNPLSAASSTGTTPVNNDSGIGQQTSGTKTGSPPVNKSVQNQPLAKTGISPVNKDGRNQPSAGTNKDTVGKNAHSQSLDGQHGNNIDGVASKISTGTNKDTVTSSAGSQPSAGTRTDTSVPQRMLQNKVQPNTTVPAQPTRRARIKPRVGIISAKAPVEKTISSNQTIILRTPPSVTIPSEKTGVGLTSIPTTKETQSIHLSKGTTGNDKQPLTGHIATTGTSTVVQPSTNTECENLNTGNSEKHSSIVGQPSSNTITELSQNVNSCNSEKTKSPGTPITQPTRRARFKPRVGILSRSSALTQRTQSKTSDTIKAASLSCTNLVPADTVSRQNLSVRHDETRVQNVTLVKSDNAERPGKILSSQRDQAAAPLVHQPSACEELSDKTLKTARTDSNVVQTEAIEISRDVIPQKYVSSHPLQDSLQNVVILPQENETISRTLDSASPQIASCLPVMMEDSSILPQRSTTRDGLSQSSSVLRDEEDTPELSTQMTAVVTDSDFLQSYHLESADDLLQSLLSAGNLSSNYVPQKNNRTPAVIRNTILDTHVDPCKSILNPSLSTRLENEIRIPRQMYQNETPANEVEPQSNEIDTTSNESRMPIQNNQTATTSRLVTKRKRSRPKSKQRSQLIESSVLDISTIPIASNIEIEPGVCSCDDVDHPVLELPVDLMQEDITQNSPKASISSGGLKQRFEQRRSGTVKLVLSRKRSESTDMDKIHEIRSNTGDTRSTAKGRRSISEDRSTVGESRSSAEDRNNTAGDKSTSQNSTKVVAEKSRGVTRRARVGPNILVGRKSSKLSDRKKSTDESRVFAGKKLELESQGSYEDGTISVDALSSTPVGSGNGPTRCSPIDLDSRQETGSHKTAISSNIQSDLATTHESTNIPPSVEECQEVANESSITDEGLQDFSDDFQFEVEVGNNELEITNNAQGESSSVSALETCAAMENKNSMTGTMVPNLEIADDARTAVKETNVHNLENEGPSDAITDTSVQDFSKDCEVEIVLEVTNTGQGYADIVCESASIVPSSVNVCDTKRALVERTNKVEASVDTVCEKTNIVSSMQENCTAVKVSDDAAEDKVICEGNSVESGQADNKKDTDPISSTQIHDISLNIPESAIEKAIRSTTGPLPEDVVECPECPDMLLCLTTVDNATINKPAHTVSQTQPGTLEDNVAKAIRRAPGEFEVEDSSNEASCDKTKPTSEANGDTRSTRNEKGVGKKGGILKSKPKEKPIVQRKRKARGKIVDDGESEATAGSNSIPNTQDVEYDKNTQDKTGIDDLGEQDGSLGDNCVQIDATQDSGVLDLSRDDSILEEPNDPTLDSQDGSGKKSSTRKRQGKTIKPKIPAKRTRKKAVAQETVEAGGEMEEGTIDAPEGENSSRSTSPTTVQGTDDATNSQKRKRGRPNVSNKTSTETSKPTEAAPVEETPNKKSKGQRRKGGLDAVVNIASMRICDMISYNPVTNPMTSSNEEETQSSSFLSGISSQNNQPESILPANEDRPEENAGGEKTTDVCAPRVTIDSDGNIVLDEESLVIQSTPVPENLDKEVVFENANQQYKAMHKKKHRDRWNKEETLLFYEILSQTGTDFSLMEKVFTTEKIKRNRTDLKKKFKREEKINRDLIDKALSQRIPLAASLFADCLEETEEEMERSLVVQTAATETAAQA